MVHKQALHAALAQVQFVAQDQQTASAARTLVSMARRTLVAKTIYGSKTVPTRIDDMFWHSELAFVNAIRTEVGLVRQPHFEIWSRVCGLEVAA